MMIEISKPFVTHLSNFERQELEVMGEFMTMDFDEVDYVFQNIDTHREVAEVTPRHITTISPVKVNHEKAGSKLKRDDAVMKPRRGKRTVSPLPMLEPTKFPNMSRKPRSHILYVFPTFDRCDSLLFFPNTMTRHLNSGDFPSLLKLFTTHLDKNCEICFCSGIRPNIKQLVKVFEFMDQMHPDMIMCVHHTKVVENEIHAMAYSKFTDSKSLRKALQPTITDPALQAMFGDQREDCFRDQLQLQDRPAQEREELASMIERGADMLVYMKIAIRLTFDECSKKGMKLEMDAEVTSLHAAERGL